MSPIEYTQRNRLINVATPLGEDVLLLAAITGHEGISSLFHYRLEMVAENSQRVDFNKLIGQKITAEVLLHGGGSRYINGIVSGFARGKRGMEFTSYHADLVPSLWTLGRRFQSRIFQHLPAPDILKKVLDGIDIDFRLEGTFEPRDYCVQYRESDLQFAARVMEEEGIYYFFEHTRDAHTLVLANTPPGHPDMPHRSELMYEEVEGGWREDERIHGWEIAQGMRSGKYTVWDHTFELPHKHLESTTTILEDVQMGHVTHKLSSGGTRDLEIYDYPGGYAKWFDGIDKSGGEQSSELQKIYQDNQRTSEIRMDQEAVGALVISGASNYPNLAAGHRFTLQGHFQDDGEYIVTDVATECRQTGSYRGSADEAQAGFVYSNSFHCIPASVPYRPARVTPKPAIFGSQTAVVVGPAGEEIFTDKYGRVKVQFHWDREGKNDADSSCWVRVAWGWAGRQWGMISIPRVEQEVVVCFEDGDPDRPLITGSVYNADMMPPYELPANKTRSTWQSQSTPGGGGFNELRFEDLKGEEEVFLHAQKDLNTMVLNDETRSVGHNRTTAIKVDDTRTVEEGNDTLTVKMKDRSAAIEQGNDQLTVDKGNITIKAPAGTYRLEATQVEINGSATIKLVCGGSTIEMTPGTITLSSPLIKLN